MGYWDMRGTLIKPQRMRGEVLDNPYSYPYIPKFLSAVEDGSGDRIYGQEDMIDLL
jgi:hypothetical protein